MQNSFTKLFETGSGATISSNFEIPDVQQNWTVFSAIYNSTSLKVYTSAEQRTTYAIEAAKDVAMPLLVGKAWSGWIDEVRLRKGVSGPVWLAAENAMLTDAEAVVCAPMTKACCGLIIVVE